MVTVIKYCKPGAGGTNLNIAVDCTLDMSDGGQMP